MGPNGPKAHFSTFVVKCKKMCKFESFPQLWGQKCSFLHFAPKKSKIRPRNPLFHKPSRQGGKKDPKMHFWTQKCIFGPKSAFWGAFLTFLLQNAPWRKGSKVARTFPHRCSKNRRVGNVDFIKILTKIGFCVVENLVLHISHFF